MIPFITISTHLPCDALLVCYGAAFSYEQDVPREEVFFNVEKELLINMYTGGRNVCGDIRYSYVVKCPKIYLLKLSAQAQKFGILMKKASLQ